MLRMLHGGLQITAKQTYRSLGCHISSGRQAQLPLLIAAPHKQEAVASQGCTVGITYSTSGIIACLQCTTLPLFDSSRDACG